MYFFLVFLCLCVSAHPLLVARDINLVNAPIVVNGLLAAGEVTSSTAAVIVQIPTVAVSTPSTTTTVVTSSVYAATSTTATLPTSSKAATSDSTDFYSGAAGIAYSPYQKDGQCKTLQMVQTDLAQIQSFGIIRTYATDCDVLTNLKASLGPSQKIMVGIWDLNKISESVSAISAAFGDDFSTVYAVSVGNELVNAGEATVADIQNAVTSARSQLGAIGYTGPVVNVDTLVAVVANPELCAVSDFLAVNSHPYWDGNVDPSNCGSWLQQQIANLQSKCGSEKPILVTETGWPSQGDSNGNCWPSQTNMETCVKSITGALGSQVLLFTTYNDYWKNPGPQNVEQHWGLFGDPEN
ncbi:LAME_0B02652g1_1 [Lachancea meyersii CBS 8951]|uniref:LAME_0B02652g1_1 n=1 Tax=Lachancea meyersii CBS 8951 TaxID=1266667 RepID=A0A1G4IUE1_9SACH|nr:LAME_0B02652g1_1 [Lachancea meyersii CBS 8951]